MKKKSEKASNAPSLSRRRSRHCTFSRNIELSNSDMLDRRNLVRFLIGDTVRGRQHHIRGVPATCHGGDVNYGNADYFTLVAARPLGRGLRTISIAVLEGTVASESFGHGFETLFRTHSGKSPQPDLATEGNELSLKIFEPMEFPSWVARILWHVTVQFSNDMNKSDFETNLDQEPISLGQD
ncbi:hypothetical protein PV10_07143 [Exophiala mesophila]|uniref:Uncharacterized protein n=1 Tax=Exophiala mesophila TaxID=212818 RepID=A0A0D1ZSG3_EXOME|nr:uncharacterized protein PV10_07143 [Exophiala mesophila]KIV89763.1 hypothetical protein PV10_07143 [Exophiala mesophila]